MNIPNDVQLILNELNNNNFKAYIVGGCVRDTLLNKTPHDWDITTSATPDEIIDIFKNYKTLKTGIEFGTVIIIINDIEYEITTFRNDGIYSDNRRPDNITFSNTIDEDLKRRDFTINALAFNGEIIDLFNGINDLNNKIIKCVDNPDKRFQEDSLRILRALRFASVLNFTIEKNTAIAIHNNKKLLKNISKERITNEFLKFMSGNPVELLREFRDVFAVIIPEIKDMFDFKQNNKYHKYDVWEHTLHTLDDIKELDLISRIVLLFHDIGKPNSYTVDENGWGHFYGHPAESEFITQEILNCDLRLTKEMEKQILELVLHHDIQISNTKASVRRIISKLSSIEQFERLMVIKRHDTLAHGDLKKQERLDLYEEINAIKEIILKEENCFKIKDLKINGNDIMNLGIPQGKEIGRLLNLIFNEVIEGNLVNEKNTLINFVKEIRINEY